jgi:hypothetical protein
MFPRQANGKIGATGSDGEESLMRADRMLIGAVLVLGAGLWVLFAYCHGNVGFNIAYPISGAKLQVDFTTMGAPALIGVPLVLIGSALLVIAFIGSIVAQFRSSPEPLHIVASDDRRDTHFED